MSEVVKFVPNRWVILFKDGHLETVEAPLTASQDEVMAKAIAQRNTRAKEISNEIR